METATITTREFLAEGYFPELPPYHFINMPMTLEEVLHGTFEWLFHFADTNPSEFTKEALDILSEKNLIYDKLTNTEEGIKLFAEALHSEKEVVEKIYAVGFAEGDDELATEMLRWLMQKERAIEENKYEHNLIFTNTKPRPITTLEQLEETFQPDEEETSETIEVTSQKSGALLTISEDGWIQINTLHILDYGYMGYWYESISLKNKYLTVKMADKKTYIALAPHDGRYPEWEPWTPLAKTTQKYKIESEEERELLHNFIYG